MLSSVTLFSQPVCMLQESDSIVVYVGVLCIASFLQWRTRNYDRGKGNFMQQSSVLACHAMENCLEFRLKTQFALFSGSDCRKFNLEDWGTDCQIQWTNYRLSIHSCQFHFMSTEMAELFLVRSKFEPKYHPDKIVLDFGLFRSISVFQPFWPFSGKFGRNFYFILKKTLKGEGLFVTFFY